jgi:hypothetical protein
MTVVEVEITARWPLSMLLWCSKTLRHEMPSPSLSVLKLKPVFITDDLRLRGCRPPPARWSRSPSSVVIRTIRYSLRSHTSFSPAGDDRPPVITGDAGPAAKALAASCRASSP